jgi:hypothetical protein
MTISTLTRWIGPGTAATANWHGISNSLGEGAQTDHAQGIETMTLVSITSSRDILTIGQASGSYIWRASSWGGWHLIQHRDVRAGGA